MDAQRGETRVRVDALGLPLLISNVRSRYVVRCRLTDLSAHGVGLKIHSSASRRAKLEMGTLMNVHFPFQIEGGFFSVGEIRWLKEEEPGEMTCGIALRKRMPLRYPIYLAYESRSVEFLPGENGQPHPLTLLAALLEDVYYLKRGVGICFRHLKPFFGRHSSRKKWQDDAETRAILDAKYDVSEALNVRTIEAALERCRNSGDLADVLTPELLANVRQAAELEEDFVHLEEYLDVDAAYPYLRSLQLLLSQIYGTYNMLVLLLHKTQGRSILQT